MGNKPEGSAGNEDLHSVVAAVNELKTDSLPIPIALLTTGFKVVQTNSAFLKAFNLSSDPASKGDLFFNLFEDVDLAVTCQRAMATGQPSNRRDSPLLIAGQTERGITYWDWTFAPVRDSKGRFEGLVCSAIETTQRVRSADTLQKSSEELETAVRLRTESLRQLNLELASEAQHRMIAENELRSLSRKLIQIQEDERRRISQELHDEIGQNLTMLKMMLDTAARQSGGITADGAKDASARVSQIIAQVRNISMSLHPSILEVLGLEPALRALFERLRAQTGLVVSFNSAFDDIRLDAESRLCAYRAVQEALTNILRYAGVKTASVSLSDEGNDVLLSIADDGIGFDLTALSAGQTNGLTGMRERVSAIGGKFSITTHPGEGTLIGIVLPNNNSNTRE
ncbi:histidine kinase [Dehalogenimonas sp. 4OHTPN]|uniref:Oxygen sensor histidine kinase NreB n=1 Tax=Dehalogenimonas sp. 4OHTPN TaxID=3166643 RepID=A0AAU8G7J0_9CHLR